MVIARQLDVVQAEGWLRDLFDGDTFEKVSDDILVSRTLHWLTYSSYLLASISV